MDYTWGIEYYKQDAFDLMVTIGLAWINESKIRNDFRCMWE